MWNKLSETDKQIIPFDLISVDWEDVAVQSWLGTLKYALKDYASSEERFNKYNRYDKFDMKFYQLLNCTEFKLKFLRITTTCIIV